MLPISDTIRAAETTLFSPHIGGVIYIGVFVTNIFYFSEIIYLTAKPHYIYPYPEGVYTVRILYAYELT